MTLTRWQMIALAEAVDCIRKTKPAEEYMLQVIGTKGMEQLYEAEKVLNSELAAKALFPQRSEPKITTMDCAECGNEFTARSSKAKCCSKTCANKHAEAKRWRKATDEEIRNSNSLGAQLAARKAMKPD